VQYADESPIEPNCILSKCQNDCGVVAREKCKTIWSWDDVSKHMQEILWGFVKEHYVFPSEQEKIGKNAMLKTIYNALRRFIHALNKYYVQRGMSPLNLYNALRRFIHAFNKYYVQRGMSPLNRFGYIMPNEWDTFVQQHTTPHSPQQQDERAEHEE
jgi:hypothetical protein